MAYIGRTPTNAALTASDLADGIVGTAKIAADAVTDAKIADDVVGTEHLTANEVDTAALGADAVTGAQLADNAVNSEHYTDGSIDTAHLADGQVTIGKLATAVLTGATDIGAAIADADLLLVDDGAGGTLRKTAASRLKTYIGSGGKVLQVLTDTTTTQVEITGTAQTATGLSIAITPSASSSKIAIFANISSILKKDGDTNVNLNLRRGGSGISNFGAALADTGNSNYTSVAGQGISYLDSPNTTSETTYDITFGKGNSNGAARVQQASGMSTMIVMEIGA